MRRSETSEERRKRIAHNRDQAIYASRKKKFAEDMKEFIEIKGQWNCFEEWREKKQ